MKILRYYGERKITKVINEIIGGKKHITRDEKNQLCDYFHDIKFMKSDTIKPCKVKSGDVYRVIKNNSGFIYIGLSYNMVIRIPFRVNCNKSDDYMKLYFSKYGSELSAKHKENFRYKNYSRWCKNFYSHDQFKITISFNTLMSRCEKTGEVHFSKTYILKDEK